ncbi:conserved hypothetical protein [Crocosphaera subtropica ATCC 51142]|uniref:Uncharacterized protein cyr0029 n=1 Tax=Crocosphaera subtropica (strain ATCC 51142 / BH68) TaxID=43989 RepID=A1KYH5_CROS5|nr:hypothetical protein [Crocosphaera subtropica]AAW57028.1 hypothetical protein [Crocosphaera subtropica ATCC 51142]ACB49950.1 conserved hypothetical protein [Crocosphaera subtropica ATCC 51142]
MADFGYTFSRKRLNLPQYSGNLDRLKQLSDRIIEILANVSLSTEIARGDILISPVITDLVHYTNAQLRIEYSLKVSEQLQGYLDYFLYTDRSLIIIEAKKGDLEYGFNQLAVQLIALDQWKNNKNQSNLLGAVTIGNIWQFGQLDPDKKHIEQGLETYRVPEDLDPLMRILVQALNP